MADADLKNAYYTLVNHYQDGEQVTVKTKLTSFAEAFAQAGKEAIGDPGMASVTITVHVPGEFQAYLLTIYAQGAVQQDRIEKALDNSPVV